MAIAYKNLDKRPTTRPKRRSGSGAPVTVCAAETDVEQRRGGLSSVSVRDVAGLLCCRVGAVRPCSLPTVCTSPDEAGEC